MAEPGPGGAHRRYNPLTGAWVLVSPHRLLRPWQGQIEDTEPEASTRYDPTCYLCPGNSRAGGAVNPPYEDVFVFDNDFGALLVEDLGAEAEQGQGGPGQGGPGQGQGRGQGQGGEGGEGGRSGTGVELLRAERERGICRVICFSPRHDLTLPLMEPAAIRRVVDAWAEQVAELGARPGIRYVQVFENKGQLMGCSNPHPHGQIWAQETVPDEPAREGAAQARYFERHGRTLLADYLAVELERGERVVLENDHVVAVVPYWALWPFETLIVTRRPVAGLLDLSDAERDGLAALLKELTTRYDNLFRTSFPYSAGLHQAPTDGRDHPEWHLHMHFYPPLLRSATVRKFMVGYEMLGMPQRDLTPESAAARLRELPGIHYLQRA